MIHWMKLFALNNVATFSEDPLLFLGHSDVWSLLWLLHIVTWNLRLLKISYVRHKDNDIVIALGCKAILKQVCIPVGCLPTAAVAISGGSLHPQADTPLYTTPLTPPHLRNTPLHHTPPHHTTPWGQTWVKHYLPRYAVGNHSLFMVKRSSLIVLKDMHSERPNLVKLQIPLKFQFLKIYLQVFVW